MNKVDIKNIKGQPVAVQNLQEHADKEFWVASTQEELGRVYFTFPQKITLNQQQTKSLIQYLTFIKPLETIPSLFNLMEL